MTLSTTALAQYDPSQLAAALQRAQQRIRQLEQENSALRTEIRWIDRLLAVPASIMSPSHKVTLRAAVKAYQQGTPDEDGLVQIESWKLCKTVGQSKQTFLENLTYCTEKLGILTKKRERLVDSDTNDYTTNLYIGVTPLLAHPHEYKVEQPRNHGGERQLCPHCHSDRLRRKVTITCMSCGSVLDEQISLVNQRSHLDAAQAHQDDQTENAQAKDDQEPAPHTSVHLTPIKTNVLEDQLDDSALLPQKPATPPVREMMNDGDVTNIQHQEASPDEQPQAQPALSMTEPLSQADVLAHAAHLLVEIAGPEPVHIEMSSRGPKKYYEVKRAITVQDTRAHLKGWKTKGAYLRRPDGMTRAICYDADTPQDWEHLLDAARFLAEAGYRPLVEDAPVQNAKHAGGGHLWIIYTGLVKAIWAHRHALEVAPMLHHIKEAWPGPGPNKVRLPGGKYVKPGFAAWCKLHDAHGARLAEDGQEATRALLDYQTPAGIVPVYPAPETVGQGDELASLPNDTDQAQESLTPHVAPHKTPGVDQHWQQKYSPHLWFHFTPAQLSDWYNERYDTDDIIEFDKHGMANADMIGRPECTPSLGQTKDRKWFTDFGASARRGDGKPDGGDVLELQARVNAQQSGASKPETMREIARELVTEATQALESAAHCGEQPPQWVQAFMSPAGWEHYHQVHSEAGYPNEATPATLSQRRPPGVGSFSPSDHDTPASHTHNGQESRKPRESAQTTPVETNQAHDTPEAIAAEHMSVLRRMQELEVIRDYGRAQDWPALLLDREELIPAGRSNWLHFVWLSQQHDQQRRVYEYIRGRSQP